MTKKKKVISVVSISLLVIVASGVVFVMIAGAFGFDSIHGERRFHKRGMPLCLQKEVGSFILWRMDKGAQALGLSENQQKRYDDFRSRLEKTMEKGMETRLEFKKQTLLEFEKDTPDLSVVAVTAESHVNMMSASLSENISLFTKFYNSLDKGQQKKITDRIKEKFENKI